MLVNISRQKANLKGWISSKRPSAIKLTRGGGASTAGIWTEGCPLISSFLIKCPLARAEPGGGGGVRNPVSYPRQGRPEPEFLKMLKYNLAESVSAGFQFNCFDICNDKTLHYRLLDHLSGLLKCIQKNIFYHQTTTIACPNPVVLSDLWKDSSSRKVDFSASRKCLRIRALFAVV